jgi:hypothetical protein
MKIKKNKNNKNKKETVKKNTMYPPALWAAISRRGNASHFIRTACIELLKREGEEITPDMLGE